MLCSKEARAQAISITLAVAAMLSGCNEDPRVSKIDTELKQHQEKILQLESELSQIKAATESDRESYKWDKLVSNVNRIAYLTPGSDGYAAVQTDLGVLTVSLVDVKPYANGTKVTLQIGNTLFAIIDGLKATIDWGKVDESGSPINDQAKSKEVRFSESLRAGAWTRVSVVLDGVSANELGFIRVKDINHTGIRLSSM